MSRTYVISTAAALFLGAAPAFAQSPFDGTWKVDLATASVDARPNEFRIVGDTYTCATCLPPFSVKADGAFHPIKDRPYWDEIAVSAVDPRTVAYRYRKGGKVVAETSQALSEDGNSLLINSHNTNNGAGAPLDSAATLTRVGPAPQGAHAASGQWKAAPPSSASDGGLVFKIKVDGERLHLESPGMGESLDATFGGPFTLNANDPGKTMTKAERVSSTVIRLTDMQSGKVTGVSTYTVSADGTSITSEWTDPRDGSKGRTTARKMP